MKLFGRRKFFNKMSIGAIGSIFFTQFPLNVLGGKRKKIESKVKVTIHPNSVRRNK